MSKQSILPNLNFPLPLAVLVCVVAVLSYLSDMFGSALVLRPELVWPLWPGCAFLVAVLLLVPRKIWPAVVAAGIAGFVLFDLQTDLKIRSIIWLNLSDVVEVLIAAWAVSYTLGSMPRLNSVKRLAVYVFFAVILAPVSAAFVSALAVRDSYWVMWRIGFFTEALALLTLTPAILGWVNAALRPSSKSVGGQLEPVVLIAGLVALAYINFVTSGGASRPVLLYSLVPFLLWSALRFGTTGTATSMLVVAFFSVWGAAHEHGPFIGSTPLANVLSLQLFLLSAAIPFMVLAALVEERKEAALALHKSEERFRLAAQAGKMFAYEWDAATDVIVRSTEATQMLGIEGTVQIKGQQMLVRVHPDDRDRIMAAAAALSPEKPYFQTSFRLPHSPGAVTWLETNSRACFADDGRLVRMIGMAADVTERKRAEEEVKESEARFRLVADTAPVLIWMSGTDKLRTYFNKPWLEFTGRSMDSELGIGWSKGVHPDDVQRCLDTYARSFELREEFRMEYRLRRQDGEDRWMLDSGVPRFNQDHTFAGYIGSCIDITESKLAQQNLGLANERLHLAMEAGRIGVWEWDIKSGRNLWLGPAHELMGMSAKQRSGSLEEFWSRVHPEDRARLRSAVETAERNQTNFNQEFRVVWPDGIVRWLRSQGKYFYAANGKPERMLGISVDMTDQKLTETELRRSEERFRLAAEAGKMYASEWDVATDSVVRSEEHIKVLGIDDAGKQLTLRELSASVHADDRELFLDSVNQLTPESPTTQICYRVLRPDGSVVWLEKSMRALFDEQGRMLRVVSMVADVTERKSVEATLATVSRRLIEAQDQERARISRELHDDICQRLSLLSIELEQLQQHSRDLPAPVRSRVGLLRNQACEVLSDIQSLSHELHSSKLQYLGIAAAIRGFCRDFGEQQNVGIEFHCHDLPTRLPSDPSLCLFRILQEALHNSAKHSGVRHFKVQLWGAADGTHLTVSDFGVGFDVKAASKSNGLGLISMQERVRLVNGTIAIDSKLMGGTTIHVRVPFISEHDSERAAGD